MNGQHNSAAIFSQNVVKVRVGHKPGSVPIVGAPAIGAVIYLGCLLPNTSSGLLAELVKDQP